MAFVALVGVKGDEIRVTKWIRNLVFDFNPMNPEPLLGVSFCSNHIVLSEARILTAIQVLHRKATS
ncbi:hypothetical protein EYF80_040863 [Liparis tanakae]|uniref:Uncharacterized protein n=1 Tax=Liparis tanakae TaxID=230148 RepID=A0A4Z2G714_9TELE|nr:hypothetical protein EYF80_040863 [Liparis tanakae]